jgi:MraZ protein
LFTPPWPRGSVTHLFTGHAEAKVDPKSRLAIPAKFRHDLTGGGESMWKCVPWPTGMLLRLYPKKTFDQMALAAPDELMPGQDEADLEADFFSLAETLEMDSAGRVLLPKLHLDITGLPADVVVIGVRDRLEIRGAEGWKAGLKDRFARMPALADRVRRGKALPEA